MTTEREEMREEIREAFKELEHEGFLRRTGAFRPSPITGVMQPVYERVPEDELTDEARRSDFYLRMKSAGYDKYVN